MGDGQDISFSQQKDWVGPTGELLKGFRSEDMAERREALDLFISQMESFAELFPEDQGLIPKSGFRGECYEEGKRYSLKDYVERSMPSDNLDLESRYEEFIQREITWDIGEEKYEITQEQKEFLKSYEIEGLVGLKDFLTAAWELVLVECFVDQTEEFIRRRNEKHLSDREKWSVRGDILSRRTHLRGFLLTTFNGIISSEGLSSIMVKMRREFLYLVQKFRMNAQVLGYLEPDQAVTNEKLEQHFGQPIFDIPE